MEKNWRKNLIYFVLGLLLIMAFYSLLFQPQMPGKEVTISEIAQNVEKGEVEKIILDPQQNKITAYLKDGTKKVAFKEPESKLLDYGIIPEKVAIDVKEIKDTTIWVGLLSGFLPVLIIIAFFWYMMRQAQSGANQALLFGRSRPRLFNPQKEKITFADVGGLQEAKQELQEIVEFLKNPQKFQTLGAEIPKGVLLVGPPGTGKTHIAKAIAGEANVPFFSISGSEFVEMFVGVGASRVRDLFDRAKKNAPCLVFVDELDAVGRHRGAGLGGSHDEREQTLNQILVEMDGFDPNTGVIILAATNRPDILDPALLRPGRFDRRVVLDLPDIKEREEILKIHTKNKPLVTTVDLLRLARLTSGFSGADLRNLVNEAAILAARRDKKKIEMAELQDAIEKVLLGPERKSKVLSEKEKEITAWHEAGHALVSKLLPHCDPVHKISIITRGLAAGYTWKMPKEDIKIYTKSKFLDDLCALLAGRAAEEIKFKEVSTGAENDLRQATNLARKMVVEYGMSETLGPRTFGEKEELIFLGKELAEHRNYSENVAAKIDQEVDRIIKNSYEKAKEILRKYKKKLDEVAKKLLKEETIEGEKFEKLFTDIQLKLSKNK